MITSLVFFLKAIFVSSGGRKRVVLGEKNMYVYPRFVRHEDSQKVKALRIPDLHTDTRGNVHGEVASSVATPKPVQSTAPGESSIAPWLKPGKTKRTGHTAIHVRMTTAPSLL
jgi:hypothetical protein